MKTVFSSTQEVCDRWAAQDQAEARTGSNTRFRDTMLFSYGTEIARIILIENGDFIALVSSNKRSSGTSKVQGEAKSAARKAGMAVYVVPVLGYDEKAARLNLGYFDGLIHDAIIGITRAVKWTTAAGYRNDALRHIATAHLYARDMAADWSAKGNPLAVHNAKEPF